MKDPRNEDLPLPPTHPDGPKGLKQNTRKRAKGKSLGPVMPTAERREAYYRGRNPKLAPRNFRPRRREVFRMPHEVRLRNYETQNLWQRGTARLTDAQERQLRKASKRAGYSGGVVPIEDAPQPASGPGA